MEGCCTDALLLVFSCHLEEEIVFCVCLNEKLLVDLTLSCTS